MEDFDKIKTRVVGIDLNIVYTTYAIVDIRGDLVAQDRFLTMDYPDVNDFVGTLAERIVMMAEENGGYDTIRSAGISAPSGNYMTGCVENAANLPWKGVIPLAAMLRDRLGIAVALANDGHLTAVSEITFGSARGMQNFITISISHGGLGSCVYVDGRAHLGVHGFAGEVGHTCVEEGGRLCDCGRRGCLETYCSAKGIVQTAEELMAESSEPTLLSEQGELNFVTIAECCDKGDPLAIEAYRRVGFRLGIGLATYASLFNPEAIILTGAMTQAKHWLLGPLRESFNEHVFPNIRGRVRLLVSLLKDGERDVLGASVLAWTVKEYSLFK